MVEIYLDSKVPLLLLSVPSDDIQRLSYRPLIMASIRYLGNLLQSHDGPEVNYETTRL